MRVVATPRPCRLRYRAAAAITSRPPFLLSMMEILYFTASATPLSVIFQRARFALLIGVLPVKCGAVFSHTQLYCDIDMNIFDEASLRPLLE